MGAWDVGSFDNDTACDWGYSLEAENDLSLVERTLDAAASESDYLDSDVACEALAAAEVVARLRGNFGVRNSYTETVDQWVASHQVQPPDSLVTKAISAIDRIVADDSELAELWAEGDYHQGWIEAVQDLRQRVSSAS